MKTLLPKEPTKKQRALIQGFIAQVEKDLSMVTNYMGVQILNEILVETGRKHGSKFPICKVKNNRVIILGYW